MPHRLFIKEISDLFFIIILPQVTFDQIVLLYEQWYR